METKGSVTRPYSLDETRETVSFSFFSVTLSVCVEVETWITPLMVKKRSPNQENIRGMTDKY